MRAAKKGRPSAYSKKGKKLAKTPTGIDGFDEITEGGLPKGRPTLIAGGPGCGKTIFGIEFLARGAKEYNEPGVFVTFEESRRDLIQNARSLGFDLENLIRDKKIIIDHININRNEIEETGEYDLEGLFLRLGQVVDETKAKRIVLDTIETLFSSFSNDAIVRSEIRRLFDFLKSKGLTALITGERGITTLTRKGLEEYISDCVILLDHRVDEQISTRRLRIIKYRGSKHGTNEYPFLIDEDAFTVMPVTSIQLDYKVSNQKVPTGIESLDALLDGGGIFKGSTLLYSGQAGSGKTSFVLSFADAACKRGEKTLYFTFDESVNSILRNMKSIGIDLAKHIEKGLLDLHASRPNIYGLEQHLFYMNKIIEETEPLNVIIDPITNLSDISDTSEANKMFVRLIDILRQKGTTIVFSALRRYGKEIEENENSITSLIDSWITLYKERIDDKYQNSMRIMKMRGMNHSYQSHRFSFTKKGIIIEEPFPLLGLIDKRDTNQNLRKK